MTKYIGKDAVVFIDKFKLSGDMNRITQAFNIDTVETSTFEDKAKYHVEGLQGWTISSEGYWNDAANQADQALQQMVGGGTKLVSTFPAGTAVGMIGYEGYGILNSYNPEATIGGAVVFSADATGDKNLFRTTILDSRNWTATGTSNSQNAGTSSLGLGSFAVLRTMGTPVGTCVVNFQSSPVGGTGVWTSSINAGTFTSANVDVVRSFPYNAAAVGPHWKMNYTITQPASFNLLATIATETY